MAVLRAVLIAFSLGSIAGCDVIPPLDCLSGAGRAGCQKDANGHYGYLYKSAMTPNGYAEPPAAPYVPPPQTVYVAEPEPRFQPPPFQPIRTITCNRFGATTRCQEP
jgi:hypothetical protein